MSTNTICVFPNPYAHLDHKGRLAGVCSEADGPRSQTAMPSRRLIGAELKMVDGSYNASDNEGRSEGGPRSSRADLFFVFGALEPIELNVGPDLRSFYEPRFRAGDLFLCEQGKVPLEQLAKARLSAIDAFKAAYGEAPPIDGWAKQFELDEVVAGVAESLALEMKAAADAAAAEAKKQSPSKSEADLRKEKLEALAKAGAATKDEIAKRGSKKLMPTAKAADGKESV